MATRRRSTCGGRGVRSPRARAVLFASLVDDPSAHPDRFPTDADQEIERRRLFALLEALVPWEATADPKILRAAQDEIAASCPTVGRRCSTRSRVAARSIPLEAQRLGLDVRASDLNPVAVLIAKALVELPPRFAGRPRVHPDAELRSDAGWTGARGLAEDVRRYGAWMREQAKTRIGHLYPSRRTSSRRRRARSAGSPRRWTRRPRRSRSG